MPVRILIAAALALPLASHAQTVTDAHGMPLGTLVSVDMDAGSTTVLTSRGYVATIRDDGQVYTRDAYYSGSYRYLGPGCSGQPLYPGAGLTGVIIRASSGQHDEPQTVYIPHDAQMIRLETGDSLSYVSWYSPVDGPPVTTCEEYVITDERNAVPLVEALTNNPAVTGLGDGPFAVPLRIAPRPSRPAR